MEQLIFVLVLIALGIGKWFLENAGSFGGGNTSDDLPNLPRRQPGPPIRRDPAGRAGEETEEERMRRFMEALGLPSTGQVPPSRAPAAEQKPPALERRPPVAQPRPDIRHLGEPFGPRQPPLWRRGKPSGGEPRPAPAPVPPVARSTESHPAPMAAPMSETAPAMEVTSLPRIEAQGTGRDTGTAALEGARPAAQSAQITTAGEQQEGPDISILSQQLGDPASLKRAILLREILGAPKGLQSATAPSIFQHS